MWNRLYASCRLEFYSLKVTTKRRVVQVNVKWVNDNKREQLTRQRLRHNESAANLQRNKKHGSNKVRLSSGTYSGVATILVYRT